MDSYCLERPTLSDMVHRSQYNGYHLDKFCARHQIPHLGHLEQQYNFLCLAV